MTQLENITTLRHCDSIEEAKRRRQAAYKLMHEDGKVVTRTVITDPLKRSVGYAIDVVTQRTVFWVGNGVDGK